LVIGLDLGDRVVHVCVLDRKTGEIVGEGRVATTRKGLDEFFEEIERSKVVMESGTHSPWISRLVEEQGHDVIVADARRLRAVWDSPKKSDRRDALVLAQLGAGHPGLLHPVHHRDAQTQAHMVLLRARERVVDARTKLINAARGSVKSLGYRLPSCSSPSFHRKARAAVPAVLVESLAPLFDAIEALTASIACYDGEVERLGRERYPATERLRAVPGCGPVTALAYVLVIHDPERFTRSRDVGAYIGVVPRQDQSGTIDRQLRITKCGDRMLRRLLVQCAHYVLGPHGPDSDIKRWGLALAERGGKNAKKRATVAVARKLAVLFHALWIKDRPYEPLANAA
jgi:transposase